MELSPLQLEILEAVKSSGLGKTFYWTGGTLLAHCYLHHRRSFDLDFFTETKFTREKIEPFVTDLKKRLSLPSIPEKRIFDRWEFLIDNGKEQTRCEFVYYNGEKKRLAALGQYRGLRIDSLEDMAANKTMAYADRNEPKDLLDLYELLVQKKFTVAQLLELVEKKFGVNWSEFMFWSESTKGLKQLETLGPYLLETSSQKQEEFLQKVRYFFMDRGRDFLSRSLA